MMSIFILFVLLTALIIISIWFTIKRRYILNNQSRKVKYLPLAVAVLTVSFVGASTIYYKIKQRLKVREFEELSIEAKKLDTSFRRIEFTSQPSDIYSPTKVDSIIFFIEKSNSLSNKLSLIKRDLLAGNIFSKVKSDIKDSINLATSAILDIKLSLEQTSRGITKENVPHGYVYAGNFTNKMWHQNNFRSLSYKVDTLPRVGDTLLVILPIFVRSGETHFVEGMGWINQTLLGTLQPGKRIIVKQLIIFPTSFVWIRY